MFTENLFSYGTLQLESVQMNTFNRLLKGRPDSIIGYTLSLLEITDQEVIASSGQTHHPIIRHSGKAADEIAGVVFEVSKEELLQADDYEAGDYKRVIVPLKSGGKGLGVCCR